MSVLHDRAANGCERIRHMPCILIFQPVASDFVGYPNSNTRPVTPNLARPFHPVGECFRGDPLGKNLLHLSPFGTRVLDRSDAYRFRRRGRMCRWRNVALGRLLDLLVEIFPEPPLFVAVGPAFAASIT